MFLVVRYRGQMLAEKQFLTEQNERSRQHAAESMSSAVDLLTSDTLLKRITGARKLIELADDAVDQSYRQRAVTAMCVFLRLHEGQDPTVEQIFLETLRARLQREMSGGRNWSSCDLDFRGAHFTQKVDFSRCDFRGTTDWRGVRFDADADFRYSRFYEAPLFVEVAFRGVAEFRDSSFDDGVVADFSGAHFVGKAIFERVTFGGEARFGGITSIPGCDQYQKVAGNLAPQLPSRSANPPIGVKEDDELGHHLALIFGESINGRDDNNSSDSSSGEGTSLASTPPIAREEEGFSAPDPDWTFEKSAVFSGAIFSRDAVFGRTASSENDGIESHFRDEAHFQGVSFLEDAYFQHSCFNRGATFSKYRSASERTGADSDAAREASNDSLSQETTFAKKADFTEAQFRPNTKGVMISFDDSTLREGAVFSKAVFDDEFRSGEGVQLGSISFRGAKLNKPLLLEDTEVTCGRHRARQSVREWPIGTLVLNGDHGDLPAGAHCPAPDCASNDRDQDPNLFM